MGTRVKKQVLPKETQEDIYLKKFQLTDAQKRVIKILTKPESIYLKNKEVIKLAQIGESEYYNSFYEAEFNDALKSTVRAVAMRNALPIVNKFSQQAIQKGEYQQGAAVLELAGMKKENTVEIDFRNKLMRITGAKVENKEGSKK